MCRTREKDNKERKHVTNPALSIHQSSTWVAQSIRGLGWMTSE